MENESNGMPQFGTAEFAPTNAGAPCAACKQPLSGSYYTVNGMQACEKCLAQLKARFPDDTHSAFVRAVLFGIGGALVGLALYAIFAIATGLEVGIVALAVGFIVGKAMHFGSKGVGGRRYQIVAVILTYLAVSLAAVPITLYELSWLRGALHQTAQAKEPAAAEAGVQTKVQQKGVGEMIGWLLIVGLASPIRELQEQPQSGIIGLIILFVGIRFAWRFTAGTKLEVTGPHPVQAAAASAV
jgi:hypothetical protein